VESRPKKNNMNVKGKVKGEGTREVEVNRIELLYMHVYRKNKESHLNYFKRGEREKKE
jgi:hypothetical protein